MRPPRQEETVREWGRDWLTDWHAHRTHDDFRIEGWAHERMLGFSCSCCSEGERSWRFVLSTIRMMPPEIRDEICRPRQSVVDMKKVASANRRANRLLRRHLDEVQRADWKKGKSFTVRGEDGHVYRIDSSSSWNVARIECGKVTLKLCVVFKDWKIPVADKVLVQKFMLQSNVELFLKIANKELPGGPVEEATAVVVADGRAEVVAVANDQAA